jgi:hypothetical protein
MGWRRLLIAPALAAICCTLVGGGTQVAHAQLPQTGSTTTTTCRVAPTDGSTVCTRETLVISGGACYQTGERLFFEDHLDSSRTYRGTRLVYDSGVHAYSTAVVVDDPACP